MQKIYIDDLKSIQKKKEITKKVTNYYVCHSKTLS